MYSYIKGTIEEKSIGFIVIENNGIGYKINVSETTIQKLGELGSSVKIYTHYKVREDDISLYGFLTNEELKMFEILISVSGVGAKTAVSILSNITPSKFALAIITDDLKTLTKLPGIGPKSAQRMVLELKDKLKTHTTIENSEEQVEIKDNTKDVEDAIQALQILGYGKTEVTKTVGKMETDDLSTEEIIKSALKLLARN